MAVFDCLGCGVRGVVDCQWQAVWRFGFVCPSDESAVL